MGLGALGQHRRCSHLQAHCFGDIANAGFVLRDDAVEQCQALLTSGLGERFERSTRSRHGCIDVCCGTHCDRRNDAFGGRVDHVEALTARGFHPLTVDIELLFVLHEPNSTN